MMEEGVAALALLFTQREATFKGKYYQFRDVELSPKPLQAHIPIYYGGNTPNHIGRVARLNSCAPWSTACTTKPEQPGATRKRSR